MVMFLLGNFTISNLYVAAGLDHDLINIYRSELNHKKVKGIFWHPNYFKTQYKRVNYDVALIEVFEFEFSKRTKIYPACLYFDKITSFGDKDLTIAGYGLSTSNIFNSLGKVLEIN